MITLTKKIVSLLMMFLITLLIAIDHQKAPKIDYFDLETIRFNPAEGSCAPCGAPCTNK